MPENVTKSISENLTNILIECPHCGHHLRVALDTSSGDQDYYDECSACCHEIHFTLHVDNYNNEVQLTVDGDDEQIF